MAVYTFTRTRTSTTEGPENTNSTSSLIPPTRDEIISQLEAHFEKHSKDVVTPEDISKIADEVNRVFEELREKPYGGFAKYVPQKPNLTISTYNDDWTMFYRERYPADYSPIKMSTIKCSTIEFSMTVVSDTKWISLAYVSK